MKIRFTIFDKEYWRSIFANEFDQWGEDVSGYFELRFGDHIEGEYCDFFMPEELLGGESLDYWFSSLLEALYLFQSKKTNYVAIRVIEYVDRWLEIKREKTQICLNVARASDPRETEALLLTSQIHDPVYEPSLDTMENYDSFYQEITNAVIKYLSEMKNLNPDLMKARAFVRLSNYLHDLENK